MTWFQLKALIPMFGEQLVGWLYTDLARATALQVALQACPGAPYRVCDQQGTPLATLPTTTPTPGWPVIPGVTG
ncbi:MAG: hypothetical protein R3B72_49420 [Polyangiaceae bacterium]